MASVTVLQPQRRKGFTPFPNDVLLDWPRLLSGNAQIFTVMYLNSETTGAVRTRGTEPPYWSRPITTEELAAFACCTTRAIQLALDELAARKVIERKGTRYHIRFDTWPRLPDRPATVVPISADAEEPEEDTDTETLAGQVIPVFSKPQRLRGGARPRPKELPAPAGRLRVTCNSEVEYSGTLCDGTLFLEFTVPKGEQEGNAKRNIFQKTGSKSNKPHTSTLIDDAGFARFERAARKVELSFSKSDLVAMHKQWVKLSADEQAAATQGLLDRAAAGEYSNPTYRPLPQNYLARRMWERAIRKPAGTAGRDSVAAQVERLARMRERGRS
jgi:hypothetical protein